MTNFAWLIGGLAACIGFIALAITTKRIDIGAMLGSMTKLTQYVTKSYFLVGIGAIIAIIIATFSDLLPPADWFRHAPSFAQVSERAWDHWPALFIVCTVTAIALKTASAKAAQQYAGVPIGILAFLLVLAPIFASPLGIWVGTLVGVSGYSRPLCPDMSPDASTRCNLTEAWSLPFSIDRLTYRNEYFRCVNVPDPKLLEWRKVGPNEFEYRSKRGILPVRFLLESSPSCPVTP